MKINMPITNVEHVMEAVVSEAIDPQGKHLDSAARRQDRTAGIKAEKEAPTMLVSAIMSDFTRHIVIQDKTVFFREPDESINQLIQTSETGSNEATLIPRLVPW